MSTPFKYYPVNDENVKAQISQSVGGGGSIFHYLKSGKHILRIMPPYSEAGVFVREIREYFFRGEENEPIFVISPRDRGDRDPIAEHAEALYDQATEESIEEAKKFRARRQFLFNALVLSGPGGESVKDGIRVLKTGVTVYNQIMDLDQDVDSGYGDITNLERGFNLTVSREGEGRDDTTYTVKAHREPTNIADKLAEQGFNLNDFNLHDLDKVITPRSFEEMTEILEMVKSRKETKV